MLHCIMAMRADLIGGVMTLAMEVGKHFIIVCSFVYL